MSSISVSHRQFLRIVKYVGRESLPGFFYLSIHTTFFLHPLFRSRCAARSFHRRDQPFLHQQNHRFNHQQSNHDVVNTNMGTANAANNPSCSPTLKCRAVVASAEIPNEKLQKEALKGCLIYHGISRNIKISCNSP